MWVAALLQKLDEKRFDPGVLGAHEQPFSEKAFESLETVP